MIVSTGLNRMARPSIRPVFDLCCLIFKLATRASFSLLTHVMFVGFGVSFVSDASIGVQTGENSSTKRTTSGGHAKESVRQNLNCFRW